MIKRLVIIGAGGHAREVAEIAHHQAAQGVPVVPLGFVDDNPRLKGQVLDGLPVLGDWTWFDDADRSSLVVICAIGTPALCRRLVSKANEYRLSFTSVVSPLAHISDRARIGEGVMIFPHVVVNTGARIGDHSILNLGVSISHDSSVGSFCNINPGVRIAGNAQVGDGCYVGMGTNVIQGRTIGAGTTVGAGAVVIRDLASNITAVGVPAAVIKMKEEHWNEQ